MIYSSSGFLTTRLEDPKEGFGISEDQGSWVGEGNLNVKIKACP